MSTSQPGLPHIQVGDKLLWKPSWNGYKFHPGPLTVTKTRPKSRNVQVAEGVPPECWYAFDSFFYRPYSVYECPACGHVGYLKDQEPSEDVVCGKCYGPTKWTKLGEKQ